MTLWGEGEVREAKEEQTKPKTSLSTHPHPQFAPRDDVARRATTVPCGPNERRPLAGNHSGRAQDAEITLAPWVATEHRRQRSCQYATWKRSTPIAAFAPVVWLWVTTQVQACDVGAYATTLHLRRVLAHNGVPMQRMPAWLRGA